LSEFVNQISFWLCQESFSDKLNPSWRPIALSN
jgi:hypothetical protein